MQRSARGSRPAFRAGLMAAVGLILASPASARAEDGPADPDPQTSTRRVPVGELLFVDAGFRPVPTLIPTAPHDGRLLAADRTAVPMRLPRVPLVLRHSDERFDHYCVNERQAGVEPAPTADRCIGLRRDRVAGGLHWIAAQWEGGALVVFAEAPRGPGDPKFHQGSRLEFDSSVGYREIVYRGQAPGLLRFSLTTRRRGATTRSDHDLVYPPAEGEPVYSIGEVSFEVIDATPVGIEVRSVQIERKAQPSDQGAKRGAEIPISVTDP